LYRIRANVAQRHPADDQPDRVDAMLRTLAFWRVQARAARGPTVQVDAETAAHMPTLG
jgi:hypothetical protein